MDKKFSEKLVDEYSLILLNWAVKKTGDRTKSQELVQNVWLQVFHAVKLNEERGLKIQKPENFVWKIAHYVWCHYLRESQKETNRISVEDSEIQLSDSSDFAERIAEDDENRRLISYMRKKVVNLNYLQREILISYYLDGKSQKEIAKKLNISVPNVKWHLFDTKQKLRQEIKTMEKKTTDKTDFIYRPKHLSVAHNGHPAPELDTNKINESLSKQNIAIACYDEPKTLDDLSKMLGIPKPYLEDDLHWLTEKEFVTCEKNKYSTSFPIWKKQDSQDIYGIFADCREELSDKIIEGLTAREAKIKDLGFFGSHKSIKQLLWFLIYTYCYETFTLKRWDDFEFPVRADGGKYMPLGFDTTDYGDLKVKVKNSDKWDYNGVMQCHNFLWFGLYNFGKSEIIDIAMDHYDWENQRLYELLMKIIKNEIKTESLNDGEKELLAKLIQKGFVKADSGKILPNFCTFTSEQFSGLKNIFAEIDVKDGFKKAETRLHDFYKSKLPANLAYMEKFFVFQSLENLGWLTTIFAFNDGKLYMPKNKDEGQFLTLIYAER